MDFTCQVSFCDEIHSTIVKEHQLLMHKKNKTEYLFSRIQVIQSSLLNMDDWRGLSPE